MCALSGLPIAPPPSIDDITRELEAIAGAPGAFFVGGEPLLTPDLLLESVSAARRVGLRIIGLQTNGVSLAEHARELAARGLTHVHVSVHGDRAAVHDYHTQREGSYDRLWQGVAAARAAGMTVIATTLLTRSSFRVLAGLPVLLQARGIQAWHIAVPLSRGRAGEDFDRVMPRLALALPFALHALDVARKLGLPSFLSGAPSCLLGPFVERGLSISRERAARAFHARCEGCAAKAGCDGLDPTYLARFDGDEIRPLETSPHETSRPAPQEPWARLFVGAGELAPPRESIHEPSIAARRALPMYGRPARARKEATVRGGKSGEALREILPALFDGSEPEDARAAIERARRREHGGT